MPVKNIVKQPIEKSGSKPETSLKTISPELKIINAKILKTTPKINDFFSFKICYLDKFKLEYIVAYYILKVKILYILLTKN